MMTGSALVAGGTIDRVQGSLSGQKVVRGWEDAGGLHCWWRDWDGEEEAADVKHRAFSWVTTIGQRRQI